MELSVVVYAALGGILPTLVWVWFWNKEDSKHPEPKQLIVAAFLVGMVAVAAVIPLQKMATVFLSGTAMVVAWAAIEEVMNFFWLTLPCFRTKLTTSQSTHLFT